MSTKTSNFGLIKPDLTDSADITAMNENWDKIDEQLKKAGESGGTDLVETELASTIYGEDPEIDPVVMNELNKHYSAKNPHGTTASDVGAVAKEQLNTRLNTSIKDKALTLEPGFHSFHLGGGSYTGNDLPHSSYSYGTAEVLIRSKGSQGTIILWGKEATKPPIWCHFIDGTYYDWSTMFLPLAGGTLSGPDIWFNNGYARAYANSSGTFGLRSCTTQKDANNYRELRIYSDVNETENSALELALMVNGAISYKKIYGEHNKPTGSYVGNGSATERRIVTGGIGNTCYIYGTNGYACHVDNDGAVSHADTNTNIVALLRKELRFVNGEIIIATTSDRCNENGKTFYWEVK